MATDFKLCQVGIRQKLIPHTPYCAKNQIFRGLSCLKKIEKLFKSSRGFIEKHNIT
jgi:hypothetical protein